MVFLSHANPEDNEFTLWLALRLAAEGFPVWCDLTQLLGGEDFWSDAENAIRQRTAKFLFVLSRNSNRKPGPLAELQLAQKVQRAENLADFVVPLAIDRLPPGEFNIEVTRLNAVAFQPGWHDGLAQLLVKLQRDGIQRQPALGPRAVATWWRERANAQHSVLQVPEVVWTNLYQFQPAELYFHKLALDLRDGPVEEGTIPYPAERFGDYLVSFAPAVDLAPRLGSGVRIVGSRAVTVGSPTAQQRHPWSYRDERAILSKLLNRAWQNMLSARVLPTYQFSTGAPAFYFKTGMIDKDTVSFRRPDGSVGHRQMIGYRTMRRVRGDQWIRYWHFAVGARPTTTPAWGFIMKPHVLFSEDGATIWDSVDRLHRARRSQCRNWWNNDWRDMNYAAVQFLANGGPSIAMPVGAHTTLEVDAHPLEIQSPVSYDEASLKRDASEPQTGAEHIPELEIDEDDEDEDEEA
jgi:TIR domain